MQRNDSTTTSLITVHKESGGTIQKRWRSASLCELPGQGLASMQTIDVDIGEAATQLQISPSQSGR